jgi:hypothetical protein
MKTLSFCALAFFGIVGAALSEPSEKEVVALMNKVQTRVAAGDVKAVDELASLPGQFAAPAFLTIFKQNYSISGATPTQKAIGERCAKLLTTTKGCEEYVVKLLKGKPVNNYAFYQQDSAIKCLVLIHDVTSIRILGNALEEVDPEEIGPKLTRALTSLNLPGAPIAPKDKLSNADALAKWKRWWQDHKADSF